MDERLFLQKLGKRIAKLRKAKGFSHDRIYLEADISRGTMSKIENGIVNPKAATLKKIADTIGVPLKSFFDIE